MVDFRRVRSSWARKSCSHFRAVVLAVAISFTGDISGAQDIEKGIAAGRLGDYQAALKEFLAAAGQGSAKAQHNLGFMYLHGLGVLEDSTEAGRWFRLAADQGLAESQYFLGNIYEIGRGVLADKISAHMWFNIASANGNEAARKDREKIERKMTPADISEAVNSARICMSSDYQNCR